jgi:hypothetical protein
MLFEITIKIIYTQIRPCDQTIILKTMVSSESNWRQCRPLEINNKNEKEKKLELQFTTNKQALLKEKYRIEKTEDYNNYNYNYNKVIWLWFNLCKIQATSVLLKVTHAGLSYLLNPQTAFPGL